MWMQDGCKVYLDWFLHGIKWMFFMVNWNFFQNHLLEVDLTLNRENPGTPNAPNCWFILIYHVWEPIWTEIHWNNIWLRAPVTYDFTLNLRVHDHTTWFWRCVGTSFRHFLLGSHNFMVTALGSCVKWPSAFQSHWTNPRNPNGKCGQRCLK